MGAIAVKENTERKIVIKMAYGDMVDFCNALSYMIDQYGHIRESKSITAAFVQEDVRQLLYESILLDLYNRLIKNADCPLRDRHAVSDKYTVKLSRPEALTYWAAINPIQILRSTHPALEIILSNIYRILS